MTDDSISIQHAPGYDEAEIEPMEPYSRMAADITMAVAELPDRTSPEDWPAAMLVTSSELMDIVDDHMSEPRAIIAELLAALTPFSEIDGEGDENLPDDTPVQLKFGRTTSYRPVTLGDLRAAREAVAKAAVLK